MKDPLWLDCTLRQLSAKNEQFGNITLLYSTKTFPLKWSFRYRNVDASMRKLWRWFLSSRPFSMTRVPNRLFSAITEYAREILPMFPLLRCFSIQVPEIAAQLIVIREQAHILECLLSLKTSIVGSYSLLFISVSTTLSCFLPKSFFWICSALQKQQSATYPSDYIILANNDQSGEDRPDDQEIY